MPIEVPSGFANYDDDRNPPPKKRQILFFLGLFLGTIALIVWGAVLLVDLAVAQIPPEVEQQLGRAIVPVFAEQAQAGPVQEALNALLDRLERQAPAEVTTDRDYQVLYVPQEVVNAIAIPGDRVIIYQGLLEQMESENELMMVLGHELGHFANRDHLRGLSRQLTVRLLLATFLGDAGSIGAIASSGASMVASAQFSQQQEYQADEIGLRLLDQEYGQVAGATDFFETLAQKQGVDLAILSTHPASKNRVQRLEQLIEKNGYAVGERSLLPGSLE